MIAAEHSNGVSMPDDDRFAGALDESAPPSRAAACRIAILNGPEIAAKLEPLPYLALALGIPSGGSAPHMIGGYGFGGKTLAAQQACLANAAGHPWWGAFSCTQGPAVFFDREQGQRLTRTRFQRLAAGHGIDLASLGDGLRLVSMPDLRLTDPNAEDVLCTILAGASVAFFDSYRAFCPGLDENDSRARDPLDMLGRVSGKTGCACFVIHHARKAREGDSATGKYTLRGSSALFDACDVVFCLAAEKGEPTYVSQEKARSHGELAEDFCLVIADLEKEGDRRAGLTVRVLGKEAINDARDVRATAQRKATTAKLRPRILAAIERAALNGRPVTSMDDVAEAIGAKAAAVRLAMRAMVGAGELTKDGKRSPFVVSLPTAGGQGVPTSESVP